MITKSKLKPILALLFITLFSFSVNAQEVTFQITSVKGTVKVDGKKVFVGSKIKAGQTIEVEEGGNSSTTKTPMCLVLGVVCYQDACVPCFGYNFLCIVQACFCLYCSSLQACCNGA